MSKKCDVIAILPIYSQFEAIQKPDIEPEITYIFVNINLLSYKHCKQN